MNETLIATGYCERTDASALHRVSQNQFNSYYFTHVAIDLLMNNPRGEKVLNFKKTLKAFK